MREKYIKTRVRHTLKNSQIDLRILSLSLSLSHIRAHAHTHTQKGVWDAINQEPHEWLHLPPTTATLFISQFQRHVGWRKRLTLWVKLRPFPPQPTPNPFKNDPHPPCVFLYFLSLHAWSISQHKKVNYRSTCIIRIICCVFSKRDHKHSNLHWRSSLRRFMMSNNWFKNVKAAHRKLLSQSVSFSPTNSCLKVEKDFFKVIFNIYRAVWVQRCTHFVQIEPVWNVCNADYDADCSRLRKKVAHNQITV